MLNKGVSGSAIILIAIATIIMLPIVFVHGILSNSM